MLRKKYIDELVEVSLVTLGKEGALIGSHGQFYSVPAEGGKPVDTTGAGDNFAAGFLYGQSIGASLVQSARIGSMLAGYVIDVVGPEIPYDKWEQIKLKVKGILADEGFPPSDEDLRCKTLPCMCYLGFAVFQITYI